MPTRFERRPGESDRSAFERLMNEYMVLWAGCGELRASVDRAAEVKAAALRREDELIKLLVGWSEMAFPQEVTALRRQLGKKVDNWRVQEWSGFFYTHLNALVTATRVAQDGAAGAELVQLRERVARLEVELRQAQDLAQTRFGEAEEWRSRAGTLQGLVEQFQKVAARKEESPAPVAVPESVGLAAAPALDLPGVPAAVAAAVPPAASAGPVRLSDDKLVERFGTYWGRHPQAIVDGIIAALAGGDDFSREDIFRRLGLQNTGPRRELLKEVRELGLITSIDPPNGLGHSLPLYSLTARGEALAEGQGLVIQHRLSDFLGRHGESQAAVVVKTRGVLIRWGYAVDLWPAVLVTPDGQQIRPDLVAVHPEDHTTIYVEVEMHGYPGDRDAKRLERFGKWRGNLDANGGCIYVACPQDRVFAAVYTEIMHWVDDTRDNHTLSEDRAVILMGLVVTRAGSDWNRVPLREPKGRR